LYVSEIIKVKCKKINETVITFNTKYGKGKGKLLQKTEEISGRKAHTNTRKLI
jgi:hypothetical protein